MVNVCESFALQREMSSSSPTISRRLGDGADATSQSCGFDAPEKFTSDIIRGGGAAVPIAVDVTGAKRLDLVVDYADREAISVGPERVLPIGRLALQHRHVAETLERIAGGGPSLPYHHVRIEG